MNNTTHVYIPFKRHREEEAFKEWCNETISSYSTEITWICDKMGKDFMVFRFGESTDALAFKMRFAL